MLVEKTNVGIRRLEGIVVALIETAGSRDKEEDMEELAGCRCHGKPGQRQAASAVSGKIRVGSSDSVSY